MICYKDKAFCNMTECTNTECDLRITEEDRNNAADLGLQIAYAEFWRQCITYEQARKGMFDEQDTD